MMIQAGKGDLLALTTSIVSAHVARNVVAPADLPQLIADVYTTLATVGDPAAATLPEQQEPAVAIKKSLTLDVLTCLECGRRQKTIKRHLRISHDLTPDQYRAKWKLPSEYPMVAPAYQAKRSELAKKIGLGSKGGRRRASA